MRIVAFQGEPGAFSEEALLRWSRGRALPLPRPGFAEVRRAVIRGEAELGILPVENSIAGRVTGSMEALSYGDLCVVGEITTPIRLALLALPAATLCEVDRVLSHPVALAQCTAFLRRHPHLLPVHFHDTAGAARAVAGAGDPRVAAIAPEAAAERYGLRVLRRDLQDRPDNRTRFVLVAHGPRAARAFLGGEERPLPSATPPPASPAGPA